MTDWSLLSHAYGPADDIPPLLERLATQPTAELWGELWSMLCHQGSTYPASFAALDWLVEQAGRPDRDQSLEGEAQWHDELPGGLSDQELQIACPGCETDLFIAIGDAGFFSSANDYVRPGHEVEKRPLEPATELDEMDELGRRLHEMATTDGQTEVAELLTYVFGRATCPACETNFPIPEALEG